MFFCTVAVLNLWSKNLKNTCEEVPCEWSYSPTCCNFNKQRTVSQSFFKVFDHNCKMVYYNGTLLRFQKLSGSNGKNILRAEYQKEWIKYEWGWYLSNHYNLLHMLSFQLHI